MASQKSRFLLAASGAVLLVALTGCENASVISSTYYDVSYVPTEFRGAGTLPVVVRGDPFALPQAELDETVADAMQGSTFGTTTRFVAAPAGVPAVYRVVMLFNPNPTTYGGGLCTRPEPPGAVFGAPPMARVRISTALCRGDEAVAYADGTIAASDARSAEFRHGVAQFAMALFPAFNPANKGGAEFSP
jgi:hypothetical protein